MRYDIYRGVKKIKTKKSITGIIGLALIVAFAGALTFVGGTARAAVGGPTCNVPTDYPTIQAAVADPACAKIKVAPGTYTEVGQIVINRNLTIVGANKNNTIIKPA